MQQLHVSSQILTNFAIIVVTRLTLLVMADVQYNYANGLLSTQLHITFSEKILFLLETFLENSVF